VLQQNPQQRTPLRWSSCHVAQHNSLPGYRVRHYLRQRHTNVLAYPQAEVEQKGNQVPSTQLPQDSYGAPHLPNQLPSSSPVLLLSTPRPTFHNPALTPITLLRPLAIILLLLLLPTTPKPSPAPPSLSWYRRSRNCLWRYSACNPLRAATKQIPRPPMP
jgi:hypothetical protein